MKLNVGCGPQWKQLYPNYEGLDIIDFGQKHVKDILVYLKNTQDKYDEVMANHFLEHFTQDELQTIFYGIYQILEPGGIFRFVVPHMKRDKAWVLTHKTFWNEETIKWLETEDASTLYAFGSWGLKELITNSKHDIHVQLKKV